MTHKRKETGGYYCSVTLLDSADVSFVCNVPDCSENKRRGTAVLTHSFPRLPTHSLTVASELGEHGVGVLLLCRLLGIHLPGN